MTYSKFAGQTYDAVWAMAFALKKTEAILNRDNISLAQYTHARKDIALLLLQQLKLLRFIGVSVSTICLRIFLIDLFIKKIFSPLLEEKMFLKNS